ncbi:MAG: CoA-binding protein [Armatimonadetes bacterium]|nr:CoA-binding protein [Armatimonadota bacterium]MDW8153646.1 CoA-binding protein [Armatimonadota bacterium]
MPELPKAPRTWRGIDALFQPRGVAIVGASPDPGSPGHQILRFATQTHFAGAVYPVHPSASEVAGFRAYPSVLEIPGPVDLVVLAVPARVCVEVARQIARRHDERGDAAAVVVVSGGFAETETPEGRLLQEALLEPLRPRGIRVVGPNCMGVLDTRTGVTTTFDLGTYPGGGLALVTQSGAFAISFLQWARPLGMVGLSKLVSVGNMADVDMTELVRYLGADPHTRVIGVYLEGLRDARGFVLAAAEVACAKPVVVYKAGRTELGARAASSHTGSLAGQDEIYEGAFRQAGILRARSMSEFYDLVRVLEKLPLPRGNRVCVCSAIGGPGTICVDEVAASGVLQLARFSDPVREVLRGILAPTATIGRPDGYLDMTGSIRARTHGEVLRVVLEAPEVDAALLLTTPPAFLDEEEVAEAILEAYWAQPEPRKPVLPVLTFGDAVARARRRLEAGGLPTFEFPDAAVRALAQVVRYVHDRMRKR